MCDSNEANLILVHIRIHYIIIRDVVLMLYKHLQMKAGIAAKFYLNRQ